MSTAALDPITLEVVVEGLIAIAREMRVTVKRTAYSFSIWEMEDFSCGLFDPTPRMVVQSEDHPGHVIPLPWSVACGLEDWGHDLGPGDLIMLNDPYRGGTHLNDVTMLWPVFLDDELFIFPAVREHWTDVGGPNPGSMSGLATTIFQEGMRIPPIRAIERGKENRSALELLFANMRLPDQRRGDFHAAVGACRMAEARIRRLVERYGQQTVLRCIATHLDRSERRMREKIAALPDGVYCYEDYLEVYAGDRLEPAIMRLRLTVAGDELTADFAGSSPQMAAAVNSSLAVTAAGVFSAVKAILDPVGLINAGAFRPIRVLGPPASIVDARPYAPAGAHGETRKRAASCTLGALAQVVPRLVSGDLCGTSFHNMLGGVDPETGREFVYYEAPQGGNGGFAGGDGPSAMGNIDFGNLKLIVPAESVEIEYPLLVEESGLREDSAGDGAYRGGLGFRRSVRLLAPEARYSLQADRGVVPPFGIEGGYAAAPARTAITRDGQTLPFSTPAKVWDFRLQAGDVLHMEPAGGGGYGDPLEREPELVRADLAEGYIRPERARDVYGVLFDQGGGVDEAGTRRRREQLAAERLSFPVVKGGAAVYAGRPGQRRVCRLHPEVAGRIGAPTAALIELHGRRGAPLRAWVELSETAPADAIALDEFGLRVLGLAPGDRVQPRVLLEHGLRPAATGPTID